MSDATKPHGSGRPEAQERSEQKGASLLDMLARQSSELSELPERYFAPTLDGREIERGAIVYDVRTRLSRLDAIEETLLPALAGLGPEARRPAQELDQPVVARRRLMDRLDDLTAGVAARDMHVGVNREVDQVMRELSDLLAAHLQRVVVAIIPEIRQLPPELLARIPDDVSEIPKLSTTRPKPVDPLKRRHNRFLRRLMASYQRLRDHEGPHHGAPLTTSLDAPSGEVADHPG